MNVEWNLIILSVSDAENFVWNTRHEGGSGDDDEQCQPEQFPRSVTNRYIKVSQQYLWGKVDKSFQIYSLLSFVKYVLKFVPKALKNKMFLKGVWSVGLRDNFWSTGAKKRIFCTFWECLKASDEIFRKYYTWLPSFYLTNHWLQRWGWTH